jgi:predicted exporter
MTPRRIALLWLLVAGLLLGHNAWLWLGQRITPDTDILALLPVQERDPVLRQSFEHMVDAAQQRVVVLVGAPEWSDAKKAADAYRKVLDARPGVFEAAAFNERTQDDWMAQFQRHRLLLLTQEQQRQLAAEPAQFWEQLALGRMYGAFGGPKLGSWQDDPFGLFAGWMQERAQETPVRPRDGYLFVADAQRQYVLLPLKLKVPAFSITAQDTVLPLLDQAAAAARGAVAGADLIHAGVILHAAAASGQAHVEMSTIGLGSLAGIVLLTWLTFRTPRPIALILLSIGVGCLGAFSVCWMLFGRVHLLTLVFGASLIGVAQDYGIYFLFNRLAADPAVDSRALLRRLMPGLSLTLLAAVIGYMGLAFTPFPGLRAMAVFSALGLVFAWLTVVCWFPLLVPPGVLKQGALARGYGGQLRRWPVWRANGRGALLLASCLAVLAPGLLLLAPNDDIRQLQNSPKRLIDDQLRLGKLLDTPSPAQFYLVRGASVEEVLQREEALKARLAPLAGSKAITGWQAVSNWVPSQQARDSRLALLRQSVLRADGPLQAVARQVGEDAAWVAAILDGQRAAAAPMTVQAFLDSPAGEPWRHLWLGHTDGVVASIVALRGMDYAGLPALRRAADGLPGVQWVDKVGEISSVLGRYRVYMGWVLAAAYGLVLALLLPRYRGRAWRVLAPVALASLATLAMTGYLGHSLQLFHVLALMLLLGVGVDYGIFMQEHPGRADATPWLAVGLSAANTLLSFGLLGLSGTPALRAFGLTMLIGTALVWLLVPCFSVDEESAVAA